MKKFNIISYTKMNGSIPVKKFILSLLSKMQAKVLVEMDLLAEYGNELDGKYTKYLEDGIFELRIKQASNITRILYFFYINKNIILTNGFVKKTQKTPKREIELAKKYKADYLERVEKMNWDEIKEIALQDSEVKKEYDALQPEYEVVRAVLNARKASQMTQQQLADKTGINRADISKLENGNSNPSIRLLQRLAEGMNMTLKLEFVPKKL